MGMRFGSLAAIIKLSFFWQFFIKQKTCLQIKVR